MIFGAFFQTSHVEAFAKSLAVEFCQKFPPTMSGNIDKETRKRLATAVGDLNAKARRFNSEHKIGIYKKAKMSNTLKWELKEMGYDNNIVDEVIKGMLIAMAKRM